MHLYFFKYCIFIILSIVSSRSANRFTPLIFVPNNATRCIIVERKRNEHGARWRYKTSSVWEGARTSLQNKTAYTPTDDRGSAKVLTISSLWTSRCHRNIRPERRPPPRPPPLHSLCEFSLSLPIISFLSIISHLRDTQPTRTTMPTLKCLHEERLIVKQLINSFIVAATGAVYFFNTRSVL